MLKGATKTTMLLSFFVRKSFPGIKRKVLTYSDIPRSAFESTYTTVA